ncbi:MAG: META domain-containing protein [Usitatibacter sp.]
MRILLAATAVLLMAGCGSLNKKEPPPKPFVGTKWVVLLELPNPGEQPHFRFGDGRMEGFGGCNRIAARFVQDTVGARAIVIGRIDRGTRACDRSLQASETSMLEILQSVSSYSITIDKMTMTGSAGSLKFVSDPPAEIPK